MGEKHPRIPNTIVYLNWVNLPFLGLARNPQWDTPSPARALQVEQISQRLAQVRRCHLDFLSGDGSREVLKAQRESERDRCLLRCFLCRERHDA